MNGRWCLVPSWDSFFWGGGKNHIRKSKKPCSQSHFVGARQMASATREEEPESFSSRKDQN